MPKCKIKGCNKFTRNKNTTVKYCSMHLARIQRHGYPELKKDPWQSLEKLPHAVVDDFILKNCQQMIDKEIVEKLKEMGFKAATEWTLKYRRRKLGIKKYLYGDVKKHRAWIRQQAIKKYGNKCELCKYNLVVDTHHIVPKKEGGLHEINNLMVVCPNCHALISRGKIQLKTRRDITRATKSLSRLLKIS